MCDSQLQFLQKRLILTNYLVKHVIKRISHDLGWYMIFIQRVVCFLSPSLGKRFVILRSFLSTSFCLAARHCCYKVLTISCMKKCCKLNKQKFDFRIQYCPFLQAYKFFNSIEKFTRCCLDNNCNRHQKPGHDRRAIFFLLVVSREIQIKFIV